MKKYIDRANVHSIIERTSTFAFTRGGMHEQVDSLPDADVVEVVRCGECRHAEDSLVLWCHEHEKAVSRLDFCSHGARMDKEADHD